MPNEHDNTSSVAVLILIFGGFSLAAAIVSLAASFMVETDLTRAFTLTLFFVGMIGAIILFGVAKIIYLLNDLRRQRTG